MRANTAKWLVLGLVLGTASVWGVDHPVTVGPGTGALPSLSISQGDTITFTNAGGFHNVVSDTGAVTSFRCAVDCAGAGGPSGAAWSSQVAFPTAGTIGYFCEQHGASGGIGMAGVITVTTPVSLQSFDVK